jgi:hypothetical protein
MTSLSVIADVGRNKSSQFRHERIVTPLPELRRAWFRPTDPFLFAARFSTHPFAVSVDRIAGIEFGEGC